MNTNDITGDSLCNIKGNVEAYAKGWDAIWGNTEEEEEEIFTCKYCGMPSKIDPSDQVAPQIIVMKATTGFIKQLRNCLTTNNIFDIVPS